MSDPNRIRMRVLPSFPAALSAGVGIDITAGVVSVDDAPAERVTFTPHGSISATNVQAALEELIDEGTAGGGEASFISATVTTLTRPANTTPYTALDSISNNATPGSVTALSAVVADAVNDPVSIRALLVHTTDTGLANGVAIRAYIYNSDPTASSGVQAGDNAAFSNKKAGLVGTMSGAFRLMFDGGVARLVPDDGQEIICKPTTGAQTLYVQYQTLGAFTPSANSTTLIGTFSGEHGNV
jgi:hypothetical protein